MTLLKIVNPDCKYLVSLYQNQYFSISNWNESCLHSLCYYLYLIWFDFEMQLYFVFFVFTYNDFSELGNSPDFGKNILSWMTGYPCSSLVDLSLLEAGHFCQQHFQVYLGIWFLCSFKIILFQIKALKSNLYSLLLYFDSLNFIRYFYLLFRM